MYWTEVQDYKKEDELNHMTTSKVYIKHKLSHLRSQGLKKNIFYR